MKLLNKKHMTLLAVISLLSSISVGAILTPSTVLAQEQAHEESAGEHKDEHGHEEGEDGATIDAQAATDMKMEIIEAQAATVQSSIPVTGKISLNRNAMAEVKARFEGVVKSVSKTQGEAVKAGDTLATVEANESLQVYPVKSPIGGVVLSRNTNIGYIAHDEPLFTVADLSKLWGEFHIFPKDILSINAGQRIRIKAVGSDLTSDAVIVSLLPVAESASQTVIARVEIDNAENKWRPGMSVHGEVYTAEKSVPVAVKVSAIQRDEGKPVIFVEKDGKYKTRAVTLGLQDAEWAEVVDGLKAGERYVAANSFIVKAQIGKAGAEHVH